MKSKPIRNWIFILHRYLGLALGLILIIVGLTGSLLVFDDEINQWSNDRQFGTVTPIGETLSVERMVEIFQTTYPNGQILFTSAPSDERHAFMVQFYPKGNPDDWHRAFINPYTGKAMGDRSLSESRLTDYLLDLHKNLMLYGLGGATIVGIVSLLLVILLLSGVMLWPGWRKLAIGFKIKWNAHPKRLNFDLHKVAGITMAMFMSFAAFTGFCWVFEQWTYPAIYALTFSSPSSTEEIIVKPQPEKAIAPLSVVLEQARRTVPSLQISTIWYPQAKISPFKIESKTGESVSLNPYTTQVLRVVTPKLNSLGDRVIGSFSALHFGTFGGLPTQILYVVMGFAPLILFITGFAMWRYRRPQNHRVERKQLKIDGIEK